MKELINSILEIAVKAPSGDNSQPWHFKITSNNVLEVYNLPERDHPILNFEQRGSLIAHGALIENIKIIASKFDHIANITLSPEIHKDNLVATISFLPGKSQDYELYDYIAERHTNRKSYKKIKLDSELINALKKNKDYYSGIHVNYFDTEGDINLISTISSSMEKIALETPILHKLFFKDIVWNKKGNEIGKPGLYIKSLELPVPVQLIFRLLKYWNVNNILNMLSFSKIASKSNANVYKKSSGFIIISTEDKKPDTYIKAGMLMQELWLKATKSKLSVQPVAGIVYLAQVMLDGNKIELISKNNIDLAINSYKQLQFLLSPKINNIVMILRVGYADQPSAWSNRMKPTILKVNS